MKLLIGADLVPTTSNNQLFAAGNAEELVGEELLDVLKTADYRIFNLEVPLTDVVAPIDKCGPALIAPTDTVAGYLALSVDCLTLANNHIMDQGVDGFHSTVKTLDESGISHVGGGNSLDEAKKPFVLEKDGKRIGIYACAEHEFSIADEASAGANPFDPLESLDHIADLKKACDYVIVLYHGGKEHYRYPSPMLQKRCRKMVEKGADLVICQHSHCIGCEEKYEGGTIVYGQGNFLFDHSNSAFWQTSLLIDVTSDFSVSYIPLVKRENTVRLAQGDEAEKIVEGFWQRSREIQEENFVQKKYLAFGRDMQEYYLLALGTVNSKNILFRVINKISGYRFASWMLRRKYDKRKRLILQNFIECEAHRELLLASLQERKNEGER